MVIVDLLRSCIMASTSLLGGVTITLQYGSLIYSTSEAFYVAIRPFLGGISHHHLTLMSLLPQLVHRKRAIRAIYQRTTAFLIRPNLDSCVPP